jgi:catechol 2,3-dioxygenase-like lactoylglutathione lyase family enzyme
MNDSDPQIPYRSPISQLRLVIEVDDINDALAFYRDTLGLDELNSFRSGEAHVILLDAGRATVELSNRAQTEMIDGIEVGRPIGAPIRIAFEVPDAASRTQALVDAGGELVSAPVLTPWNSLNSRVVSPEGWQLTLFQQLGDAETWAGESE